MNEKKCKILYILERLLLVPKLKFFFIELHRAIIMITSYIHERDVVTLLTM